MKKFIAVSCLIMAGLVSRHALAIDTNEQFGAGAVDLELYAGAEGLTSAADEYIGYGDIYIGYGLHDRLSAYMGATPWGGPQETEVFSDVYVGLFGTPLETDHFDIDIFLDATAGGSFPLWFQLAPALELNFDMDPDMQSWGLFSFVQFPIVGDQDPEGETDGRAFDFSFSIQPAIGVYYRIASRHELLAQFDMLLRTNPGEDERAVEVGRFAVGYNLILMEELEWIELITEGFIDIPQGDEEVSGGVMAGIIIIWYPS